MNRRSMDKIDRAERRAQRREAAARRNFRQSGGDAR